MAPSTTIKKSYQCYKTAGLKLETQLEQLRRKKEEIESRAFVVLEESGDISASSGKHLVEEQEVYRSEVGSLVSTATDVLLEILELKLSFVQEALSKLSTLVKDCPKGVVPPELGFPRYEEWLETNQRLFELNSQLYDLEKLKFEIRHKKRQARWRISGGGAREGEGLEGSQFVQSSIQRIQGFLTRFRFPTDAASTSQTYIQDLLSPRGDRTTLEAQKVQEYVAECMQHTLTVDPSGNPRGAHQLRYQEFMGVLCGYIVEKQREWQGEELPYDLVHNTVERHLMPKIKSAVLRHMAQANRDELISRQCQAFSDVTLEQLRVKPQLRSQELVPFIDSISSLRASYFSPNPTDKMYTIVAAAKALYDQLGVMGEMSIDGDSFLDLWIYVILKANVKDLATNLCFMVEYGNPQLANDEAGYYLTTLEAAVSFIEGLVPEQLNQLRIQEDFVVCEREHFSQLACLPGSCFRVVREGAELQGYQVAIIQEWALNRARLFRSVLVPTGEPQDTAVVDIVRLSSDSSSAAHLQHFSQALLNPKRDMECLRSQSTPFGMAVVVDITTCDPLTLIILPSGDFDKHSRQVERILQLTRLGSQGRGESCDVCIIPATPSEEMSFLTAPEMPSGFSNGPGVSIPLRNTLMPDDGSIKSASVSESDPYLLHSHLRQSYSESIASSRSWRLSNTSFADGIGKGGLQNQTVPIPDISIQGSKPSGGKTVTVQAEVYDPTLSGVSSYFSSSEHQTGFLAASPIAVPDLTASMQNPARDQPASSPFNSPSSLPPSFAPVSPPSSLMDILRPKKSTEQKEKEFRLSQMYYCDDSSCPINIDLVNPNNILSPQYGKELEGNFVENHLFGDLSQPLDRAMAEIITQGQLYLQRLNYLSITQALDGVYNDATLYAVKRFQIAHNRHESMYTTVLPENGHLTVPTFQYLRQAFLTIFASLLRLGLDRDLGDSFNPMSTGGADVQRFRECVEQFQREHSMAVCQRGTLCANTIDRIRHILRTRRHTIS